jgi:hypothetical protein
LKENDTVFLCDFMTEEIEETVVIETAVKPQCFKSIDIKKLSVFWKSKKKA